MPSLTFDELANIIKLRAMLNPSSKPRDVNALARAIVDEATGESQPGARNPHAVAAARWTKS